MANASNTGEEVSGESTDSAGEKKKKATHPCKRSWTKLPNFASWPRLLLFLNLQVLATGCLPCL